MSRRQSTLTQDGFLEPLVSSSFSDSSAHSSRVPFACSDCPYSVNCVNIGATDCYWSSFSSASPESSKRSGGASPDSLRAGLVSPHISQRGGSAGVQVARGRDADLVGEPLGGRPAGAVLVGRNGVVVKAVTSRDKKGGGRRGGIYGFSRAAQRRLLEYMARLNFDAGPCHFLTATYHQAPESWEVSKEHLNALHMAFLREFVPKYGGGEHGVMDAACWKIEVQSQRLKTRGELVPHYHMLVFWEVAPSDAYLIEWFSRTWNRIAEPDDAVALRVATKVQNPYNTAGGLVACLMSYIGKYLGKAVDRVIDPSTGECIKTGRIYGQWGQPPELVHRVMALGPDSMAKLIRRVRKWGRHVSPRYLGRARAQSGGRLVLGDGSSLKQLLRGLDDPVTEISAGAVSLDDLRVRLRACLRQGVEF